jgi:hypothetical protein
MSRTTPGLKEFTEGDLSKSEREESWRTQIKAQKATGLSARKFCEIHNLNFNTFRFWQRKIKNLDLKKEALSRSQKPCEQLASPFTALKLVSDEIVSMATAPSRLTVNLPGGANIQIEDQANIALAAKLLAALRGI